MLRVLITKTGGQETGVTLVTADKVSLGRIVRQKWITHVMNSHVKTTAPVHHTWIITETTHIVAAAHTSLLGGIVKENTKLVSMCAQLNI
jgi:hypothetical protein